MGDFRPNDEIGIHSLRAADVVGEHTITFFGKGERVELIHRVTTRDAFAQGAVRTAQWVVGQKPGFYDMQDVLGLR
jgi:4-hydroxy-tetrahydrodipicolinate reductase